MATKNSETLNDHPRALLKEEKRDSAGIAIMWALLFLGSTNDIYGYFVIGQLRLKPFAFSLPLLFIAIALLSRDRKSLYRDILVWVLLPSVVFTTWDAIASYLHTAHFQLNPYCAVILLSFSTYGLARLLAKNFPFPVRSILLASGTYLSLIGLVQFFCSLLGFRFLWAQDWWITYHLPRVNGLTYEPSYFALTLMPFTAAIGYLSLFPHDDKFNRRAKTVLFLLGAAIGISSSRASIVFALLFLVGLPVLNFTAIVRRGFTQLAGVFCWLSGLLISLAVLVVCQKYISATYPDSVFDSFAHGTGVAGSRPDSVFKRLDRMESTFKVATIHPLIGVGLANIPQEIWKIEKVRSEPFERQPYIPMNPYLEILAGWGFLGGFAFFVYVSVQFLSAPLTGLSSDQRILALAVLIGLLSCLLLLNYNQNLFRYYIWLFLGLTAAACQHASVEAAEKT